MALLKTLRERFAHLRRPHRTVAISAHRGLVLARRFAIGAALVSLFIYWLHPPLLERLDIRVRDLAFQLRQPPSPPKDVVIVSIDEKSVKLHGRWPWPRAKQAQLIERLKEYGAKVIALDIIYTQPQDRENDDALTNALTAIGPPVVGGYFFRDEQTIQAADATIEHIKANRITTILEKPEARYDTVESFPYVEANQPLLAPHFSAFGYFNAIPDSDGLIRSAPMVLRFGDDYYPSLPLQALAVANGLPLALDIDQEGIRAIRLGHQLIPVNSMGKLPLNFYNSKQPIPLLSAADVLNGSVAMEFIQNSLVFVGVTELGIADVRPTPIDHSFPGVAIHATVAANIIQEFHLFHNNQSVLVDVLLMALLPLLMVWIMSKVQRPIAMTAIFLLTTAFIWMVFYWAVTEHGLLISFLYPLTAIFIGYTIFEMYEILVIQSRNRYIQRAFSSYVPPALVKQLIKDPDGLNLKGEKRRITVLFSDIRGFTTISESLSPERLGQLLNAHLGAMTEVLFKQKGTLDKYIGDAVMAFYNAPLDDPDHPLLAARTAINMQNTQRELNKKFEKEYNINMRIGVGVHTGEAIVGNFGSPRRFNYTAMGDTVNLASRLEGQTKYYGVDIIISGSTFSELNDEFQARKLDKIRVKGKHLPVEIFQLFADGPTQANIDLTEIFNNAMELYYAGNFQKALDIFKEINKTHVDDRPTLLLIERCQHLLSEPPEQWDGVHTATSK